MRSHCNLSEVRRLLPALLLALTAPLAYAGARSSTSYTVLADTTDAGGQRAISAAYTNQGSIGGVVGISTVPVSGETAKAGYIGQLFEVASLQLTASPMSVDEGGTRQLSAAQLLDDSTTIALAAGAVTWSVQGGPLTSIGASGLANADSVFEDSVAVAQGDYAGATGSVNLTVLDTVPDNFGDYAGDGIDDGWQVQYFGIGNALAAPAEDPDGDGQDNAFEFTAGVVPTDPASAFEQSVETVPGQPGQTRIIFSPRLAGRTYTVMTSTSLLDLSWISLNGSTETDDGDVRTLIDPDSSAEVKFYKIEIVMP